MRRTHVRITSLLLVIGATILTWSCSEWLRRAEHTSAERVFFRSVRSERDNAQARVTTTRLIVDDVHKSNARAIRQRDQLRRRGAPIRSEPTTEAGNPDTLGQPDAAVPCSQLLRVDDRLVDNLRYEIIQTRELLQQYQELTAAYQRELDVHEAVRRDYVRRNRRRRVRNRTLFAAAAVVTAVVLLDR